LPAGPKLATLAVVVVPTTTRPQDMQLAHAVTQNSAMQVSLTIIDSSRLISDALTPPVTCPVGGQDR